MDGHRLLCIAGGLVVAGALGAFILWGPSTRVKKKKKDCVRGLVNLGYTCFLNTLLQALASCPQLIEWLQQLPEERGGFHVITALRQMLCGLNLNDSQSSYNDTLTPASVVRALRQHGWVITQGEQDAHEMFHVLMGTLDDELKPVLKLAENGGIENAVCESRENGIIPNWKSCNGVNHSGSAEISEKKETSAVECSEKLEETSLVKKLCEEVALFEDGKNGLSTFDGIVSRHNVINLSPRMNKVLESPFRGYLASQLQCKTCGHKSSVQYDKFDSLSLSLGASSINPVWSPATLQGLLSNFVAPEIVKEVACDGCSKKHGLQVDIDKSSPIKSTFVKQLTVGKLPTSLCFHIQRTTWLPNGQPCKRHDFVEFPEILAMDSYTYNFRLRKQVQLKRLALMALNNIALSASEPDNNNSLESLHSDEQLYRLHAVVVHTGDVMSGHFVTYRKGNVGSRSRNRWYYTSDTLVKESSLSEVLRSSAYMLFYEKVAHL